MQVAIACIKVASQAVSTMPSLFFFPIIPFIMTVCLIVYWVAVAGYLYSAGTITAKMTTASSSTALTISVSHHCLCLTLVLSIIQSISMCLMSLVATGTQQTRSSVKSYRQICFLHAQHFLSLVRYALE